MTSHSRFNVAVRWLIDRFRPGGAAAVWSAPPVNGLAWRHHVARCAGRRLGSALLGAQTAGEASVRWCCCCCCCCCTDAGDADTVDCATLIRLSTSPASNITRCRYRRQPLTLSSAKVILYIHQKMIATKQIRKKKTRQRTQYRKYSDIHAYIT